MEQIAWVVVALAVVGAVVWFVLRGRRERAAHPAGADHVEDPWEAGEEEVFDDRPVDATPPPPQVMTRDSLINRDRRLDPTKWDNHTGDGGAGAGGDALDASFFDNLRRRQAGGDEA